MKKILSFILIAGFIISMAGTQSFAAQKTTTTSKKYSSLLGYSEVEYENIRFRAGVKNKTTKTRYACVYLRVYDSNGNAKPYKSSANITSAGSIRSTAATLVPKKYTAKCNCVIHSGTTVSTSTLETIPITVIKK